MKTRSNYLISLLIVLLIGFVGLMWRRHSVPESIKIEFKLINKTAEINNKNQFCAEIKLINCNHPTIMILPHLEYGFKSYDEAFYMEAYTLKDEEVNITTPTDYDWNSSNKKMMRFSIGDTLNNTICSSGIYEFKEKGVYKLRFVFNPNKPFAHKGKTESVIVYSNWDTITVK